MYSCVSGRAGQENIWAEVGVRTLSVRHDKYFPIRPDLNSVNVKHFIMPFALFMSTQKMKFKQKENYNILFVFAFRAVNNLDV